MKRTCSALNRTITRLTVDQLVKGYHSRITFVNSTLGIALDRAALAEYSLALGQKKCNRSLSFYP
jgi:hypothetical protein